MGTDRTIAWLLQVRAADRPTHPFLVWEPFAADGRTWTYAEFAHDVAAIAEGLRRRGVGAGDMVLVHLENGPEYVLTWFACAWIGAVAVCTNTRSSQDEMSYFGSHSGASVVVTQPNLAPLATNAIPDAKAVLVTDHNAGEPVATTDRPSRVDRWAALLDNEPGAAHRGGTLDPVLVLYTSGSTGRPKAVTWTHASQHDVGSQGQRVPLRSRARRRDPGLPAAVPHQRAVVLDPAYAVGGRNGGTPTTLLRVALLGCRAEARLHVRLPDQLRVACPGHPRHP